MLVFPSRCMFQLLRHLINFDEIWNRKSTQQKVVTFNFVDIGQLEFLLCIRAQINFPLYFSSSCRQYLFYLVYLSHHLLFSVNLIVWPWNFNLQLINGFKLAKNKSGTLCSLKWCIPVQKFFILSSEYFNGNQSKQDKF